MQHLWNKLIETTEKLNPVQRYKMTVKTCTNETIHKIIYRILSLKMLFEEMLAQFVRKNWKSKGRFIW